MKDAAECRKDKIADSEWGPELKVMGSPTTPVQEYKFLRVMVSNDLRFAKDVVEIIVKKCRKCVSIFNKCLAAKSWGNSLKTQRLCTFSMSVQSML